MSSVINKRRERRRDRRNRPEALLQNEQVVKLQAIGAYLRQARQQQSLSLEQVEVLTKIQPRLLSAIEDGRLDQLPEPVFVQGYIKLFAQALGLDGTSFAATFPTDTAIKPLRQSQWRTSFKMQLRPIHLYCLYACLIFAAVNGLSYLLGDPSLPEVIEVAVADPQQPPLPANSSAAVNSTTTQAQISTTNSPMTTNNAQQTTQPSLRSLEQLTAQLPFPTVFGTDTSKPLQVGIKLKEQSWLRIEADGKTLFEGVLTEGTEKAWSADKTVTLRAGNAGGVLVAVNNSDFKPMGDPGAVEEKTIASTDNAATGNTGKLSNLLMPTSHSVH